MAAGQAPVIDEALRRAALLIAKLQHEHTYCDVVISLQDGKITLVRVNRSFKPEMLPST